jgi:ribosomal protein S19E (S16A)
MVARGSQAVRAEGGTVRKVIDALKVKGGVEITQDGVRLAKKPRARRY